MQSGRTMTSSSAGAALALAESIAAAGCAGVAAARSGNEEAVLALLARHRPPLVRLLCGVLGDPGAAEDVAQETFLHALPRLGQLRDPAAFYPWVRQMALRRALRRLKQRREEPVADLELGRQETDPAGQAQTRVLVHDVLARLPAEQRVTLLLREMEQLDYEEIAAELAIPVGTVRSRLFAARERFRALWEALEAEE